MVKCKVCGKTYHDNIVICSHGGAPIDNYVSAGNSISKELVKKGILESKKRVDKIEGVNVPYISLFILIPPKNKSRLIINFITGLLIRQRHDTLFTLIHHFVHYILN